MIDVFIFGLYNLAYEIRRTHDDVDYDSKYKH